MLRRTGYAVAMAALAVAVYGVASAALGTPSSGVGIDDAATAVQTVVPGSPGWRDGIRPGDEIIAFHSSDEAGGWSLMATDGTTTFVTTAADQLAQLRDALAAGVVGLALVASGLLVLARGSAVGLALAAPGAAIGTVPLALTGRPGDLVVAGIAAFLLAGSAAAALGRRRVERAAPLAAGAVLGAAWIAAIRLAPAAFDALDAARVPAAVLLGAWGAYATVDRERIAGWAHAPDGPRLIDLAMPPLTLGVLGAAVLVAGLSPAVAVLLLAIAVVAYPGSRRLALGGFERLVVGSVRRRAEDRAAEDERGRIAREIHDAPLQELAAVIRRLEANPTAGEETDALRDVAAQLREVASALRSPVLEDLGLGPALQDLAEALAAEHPACEVACAVDDLVGRGPRPPADVEVAAFRIAQEAAGNALRHSRGTRVSITATVGPAAIEVAVADDGAGFDRGAVAAARRGGHVGLDSMRERAAAVGGRLAIESGPDGTRVRFAWEGGT
jgi:signal transduction histidine kinase